jgi:DNA polymerase I
LFCNVHLDARELVQPVIKEKMIGAVNMIVPLEVDMNYGENWLQAH